MDDQMREQTMPKVCPAPRPPGGRGRDSLSPEPTAAHTPSPPHLPLTMAIPSLGRYPEARVGQSCLGYRTRGFWGSCAPSLVCLFTHSLPWGCKPQEGEGLLTCNCATDPRPCDTTDSKPTGVWAPKVRCCRGKAWSLGGQGHVGPAPRTLRKGKPHRAGACPWGELGSPASQEWGPSSCYPLGRVPSGDCW